MRQKSRGGIASRLRTARLRLLAQRRGKRGDSGEEVLALFLPAKLDDLIVLGVEHRGQIPRDVVIEIEPGLCIRAPGMLNLQSR